MSSTLTQPQLAAIAALPAAFELDSSGDPLLDGSGNPERTGWRSTPIAGIPVLPVDQSWPDELFWEQATAGDNDERWLDITAWSASRGGDVPYSAITVTPNFSDLVIDAATFLLGVALAGGGTIPLAIQVRFDATAAQHRMYRLTVSFTTVGGETINRDIMLPMVV
jgi:hypothetical protein